MDYDKYRGHSEGPWKAQQVRFDTHTKAYIKGPNGDVVAVVEITEHDMMEGLRDISNMNLVTDAPLLLARYKELETEKAMRNLYIDMVDEQNKEYKRYIRVVANCNDHELGQARALARKYKEDILKEAMKESDNGQ